MTKWKALCVLVYITTLSLSVLSQSNENAQYSDEFDDWADFDDLFKESELDDYETLLKKINEAKDNDFKPQSIQDDEQVDQPDEELQIEDTRFENEREYADDQNEPVDNVDNDGDKNESVDDDADNNGQSIDESEKIQDNWEQLDTNGDNINEKQFDGENKEQSIRVGENEKTSQNEEENEYQEAQNEIEYNEIIGDENMNGNAPSNDYDPQESVNEADISKIQTDTMVENKNQNEELVPEKNISEGSDVIESPYGKHLSNENNSESGDSNADQTVENVLVNLSNIINNPDEFFGRSHNPDVEINNDNKENAGDDNTNLENASIDAVVKDTFDIVQDNKETKNFHNDEENKDYADINDIPKDIVKETQSILKDISDEDEIEKKNVDTIDDDENKEDSDDEYDDIDTLYDDIEEDIKSLMNIMENLRNDEDIDSSPEVDEDNENSRKEVSKENDNQIEIPYGNDALEPADLYEDKKNSFENLEENRSALVESVINEDDEKNKKQNDSEDAEKEYTKKELSELSSQEVNDKINEFIQKYEDDIIEDFESSNNIPVNIKLSLDEAVVVTSPNYPEPYGGNSIVDWFFDGEGGTGIEFNITEFAVDGNSGDYLLVKPGQSDVSGSDGIIFSFILKQERRYRFMDVDNMFVRFESKGGNFQNFKGFQFSVKFIEPKAERALEPEPIPEASVQYPEETLTVHLSGFQINQEDNITDEFRNILIDMTTMFINREDIDLGELPLDQVVQLTRVAHCNINWPYTDSCMAVSFGVPLYYTDGRDYQLTNRQLEDMWISYSTVDPFATRMRMLGISMYDVPNERAILSAWWSMSFAVLIIVVVIAFVIFRWNCFREYNGMTRLREETDSLGSARKSDLSLYPTPHQNLPAMFADGKYDLYLDGDYTAENDTTRVDIGGAFNNKSFVRDGELMDLDSDEEIIMSLPDDDKAAKRQSYSSGIRPRDVYEV